MCIGGCPGKGKELFLLGFGCMVSGGGGGRR